MFSRVLPPFPIIARLGLLSVLAASPLPLCAGYNDPFVRVKVVPSGQPVTAANQPILALPLSGPAAATLVAESFFFTPTSYAWSQVRPAANNSLASPDAVAFSANSTFAPQVDVTFPSRGVYQLQVVATNGTVTASQYVWIQVWDRVSGFNPLQQVGRNPGITPPPSVRPLSPDPGPYCHPRLLFTRADWPELNAKTKTSTEVSSAITSLQNSLAANFDKATAPAGVLKSFADILVTYADGGYDATYYANTVLPFYTTNNAAMTSPNLLARAPRDDFPDALLAASYLAWVNVDPTQPQSAAPTATQDRLRYLSKLAAAFAKVELVRANGGTVQASYDMAVVYDLLYDWMTEPQRTTLRDYLYAIGYDWFNTGAGGLSRTQPAAWVVNGDFPNQVDGAILASLAIEGEEASVTPSIQATYGPNAPAVTGPSAWPFAAPSSVYNLARQSSWLTDTFITPWGSALNHHAYLEWSLAYLSPSALALARRGQNNFVTTHLYQSSLSAFNVLYPRQSDGRHVLWDHHDATNFNTGPGSNNGRYILKYMFPDDPLIDFMHRAFRAEGTTPFAQAVFGTEPGTQNLAAVAAAKNIPLTRFDPFRGAASTRNSWADNDLALYFECRADVQGHMHAEANNFSLYALGRAWSCPPGYHCTINDLSATVLIQDPTLASDPATEGYIGQSPSSATMNVTRSQHPPAPAKFLEAVEDPAGQWTLFAGDASSAYRYANEKGLTSNLTTGRTELSFFYEGWANQLTAAERTQWQDPVLVSNLAYNPVQYAFRTVFAARGARPYVLVLDDITVDGVTPRNYRWNMPAAISFGPSGGRFVDAKNNSVFSSMAIQANATATEAVLYHSPIDDEKTAGQTGLPRLLVRDVTEQATTGQPAITLDKRAVGDPRSNLTYGWDNNSLKYGYVPSSRLLITRQNVAAPAFKVLLFPYRTGELPPITSWSANQTVLTIDLRNGFTDRITLDATRADRRTRVVGFSRTASGRSAPTVNVPGNLTVSASPAYVSFLGQDGAAPGFSVTATDDTGAPLTPVLSPAAGTIYPTGTHTVTATATDSRGQTTTRQFTVTVTPYAPPAPPAPWTLRNIGTQPVMPGSATFNPFTKVFAVTGNGGTSGTNGDIWSGTSEGFTYLSQNWTGDGIFTARVASFSSMDSGAKAGIMFRETLTAGAKNSIIYMTRAGSAIFQNKTATNGGVTSPTTSGRGIPEWIRLVRSGNTFTGYYSDDGVTWTQQGNATAITMNGTALTVGLAAAPRTGGTTANVTFDNVSFVGRPAAPASVVATPMVGRVDLAWTEVKDAAGYSIRRASSPGGAYSTVVSGVTVPSFADTGLSPGSTGYYVITATNAVGESPLSDEVSAAPLTPLQGWRRTHFDSTANSGDAQDLGDADGDGASNLLEYAVGTDPRVPGPPIHQSRLENSRLKLTFPRLRTDVTYLVEGGSDFGVWTTLATNPGTVGQNVTVSDTVNASSSGSSRRFLRLRVTNP